MAHAIWSGAINFGLVTIPVKLFTAVREQEGVHFHLLHAKDQGRIHNVRRCEACGKEVAWNDLVRGYEHARGEYVVVTEEEIDEYRPEATQSIDIVEFVEAKEIDPILFDTPYYLEPEKKAQHSYALLREALTKSGRVGIAKVVIRTRQRLAAVKPDGDALVLATMHFAREIVDPKGFELPAHNVKTPEREMKAAMMLIDAMATTFDPKAFHDTYQEELRAALEERAKGGHVKSAPKPKRAAKSNVVDLVEVLERSLAAKKKAANGNGAKNGAKAAKSGKHRTAAKHAAHARAS